MTIRQLAQRFGKPLIIVVIALCTIVMVHSNLKDITRLHPQNYAMLAVGMALFVATYLVQAVGWHLVLRALGQPIALRDSARMFFLSLIARWIPGRIWYTATRLYIGRQVGLSVTAVAFGIVLELIYILVPGVIVTVAFAGSMLGSLFSSPHGQLALYGAIALVVIAGVLAVNPSTLTSISRLGAVRRFIKKIADEEINDANRPEMSTKSSLLLILYFSMYWIFSGVAFAALAAGFIPMDLGRWLACIPAFAGSWLIGFFSFVTPAGIGVREFAMTFMLQNSMGQAEAIVMSIASRVAMMVTELLLSGITLFLTRGQSNGLPFFGGRTAQAAGAGQTASLPVHMIDRTMRMAVQTGLQPQPASVTASRPAAPRPTAEPNELLRHAVVNGSIPPPPALSDVRERLGMQLPAGVDPADTTGPWVFPSFADGHQNGAQAPYPTAPALNGVSHNGAVSNGFSKRQIGGRSRLGVDWTLVKRRPCFCGREQVRSSKIPVNRYKPFKRQPAGVGATSAYVR